MKGSGYRVQDAKTEDRNDSKSERGNRKELRTSAQGLRRAHDMSSRCQLRIRRQSDPKRLEDEGHEVEDSHTHTTLSGGCVHCSHWECAHLSV